MKTSVRLFTLLLGSLSPSSMPLVLLHHSLQAAVAEHKQNTVLLSVSIVMETFPSKKGEQDKNYKQQILKYFFLTFWSVWLHTRIIPLSRRPQLGKVLISV